jgi:hypothetical protein
MKKYHLLLVLALQFIFGEMNAATLRIRLSPTTGDYTYLGGDSPNIPYLNHKDFAGVAWTNNGTAFYARSFMKFDLSQLPSNAIVSSVSLSLYGNTQPINPNHSTLSGSNNCFLRRVTQSWSSSTATFNNMPTHSIINQVPLAASTSSLQNYSSINVTNLFNDILASGQNNGILIMLGNEQVYRSLNFASGANTDSTKRPLLEINYTISPTCNAFLLNHSNGFDDALVLNSNSNLNFQSSTDFVAFADNTSGTQIIGRSLFYFDKYLLPANINLISAELDLYCNLNPNYLGTTLGGGNECLLTKVNQNWDPSLVSFSNQPSSILGNSVLITAPTTSFQNYLGIDVKGIINDILSNPSNGYGIMLQLINETGTKSLNFCSANYPNASLRPKINFCFVTTTGVTEYLSLPLKVTGFPNPTSDVFTIKDVPKLKNIYLINSLGSSIVNPKFTLDENEMRIDLSSLPTGIYQLKLETETGLLTSRIVKI